MLHKLFYPISQFAWVEHKGNEQANLQIEGTDLPWTVNTSIGIHTSHNTPHWLNTNSQPIRLIQNHIHDVANQCALQVLALQHQDVSKWLACPHLIHQLSNTF